MHARHMGREMRQGCRFLVSAYDPRTVPLHTTRARSRPVAKGTYMFRCLCYLVGEVRVTYTTASGMGTLAMETKTNEIAVSTWGKTHVY